MPVDVQKMGCDFLAFSGHKMLGPTGIGVLYGRREAARGHGALRVRRRHDQGGARLGAPGGTTSRTSSRPGPRTSRAPWGSASRSTTSTRSGWRRSGATRWSSPTYAFEQMGRDPRHNGLRAQGRVRGRGGVVSFNLGDIHPHDMASILDEEGVAIRSGHHCAQPLDGAPRPIRRPAGRASTSTTPATTSTRS